MMNGHENGFDSCVVEVDMEIQFNSTVEQPSSTVYVQAISISWYVAN